MNINIFGTFAPLYWAHNLPVIPLKEHAKAPIINQWSMFGSRMPTEIEMQHWLASFPKGNIGLPLGPQSGLCMIDIDTEDQELEAAIREICGPTPWVRVGKKGMALAYRFAGQPNFKLRGANGAMICEFLGLGNQVVLPPSIHPDCPACGAKNVAGPNGACSACGVPSIVYSANTNLWEVLDQIPTLPMTIEERLRTALAATGHGAPSKGKRGTRAAADRSGSDFASRSRFQSWLQQHLDEAKSELGKENEGGRNNRLFQVAVRLAEDVAAAGEDWPSYADELAQVALAIGLGDREVAATLDSAWRTGRENPTAWIRLARDWIYVSGADQFMHLASGERLSQQAFRTEFNHLLSMKKQGNVAKFLTDGGYIEMIQNVSFDPCQPRGIYEAYGRHWLNTYCPSAVEAQEGDATPFREFVDYLVPEPAERDHLLKMIAHLVRNPGQKLNHALIFGSREHGIGKSTLMEILFQLMGPRNCRKATTEEIESPYQSYIEGKLLVLVEEINFGVGPKAYNKMKDLITATTSPVRRLYQDVREVPNMATFVFLTNLEVPILIDQEDRRIFMINSPAVPREPSYYVELNQWWRANLGVIRAYLDEIELEDFDPCARPPMTQAKAALIERSRTPVVQELLEMLEERQPPFHVDVLTLGQISDAINRRLPRASRNAIQNALRQIGAVDLGQHRIGNGMRIPGRFIGTGDRPCLWAVRHPDYWQAATPKDRIEEYLADEGRLTDLHLPACFGVMPASSQPPVDAEEPVFQEERLLRLLRSISARTVELVR